LQDSKFLAVAHGANDAAFAVAVESGAENPVGTVEAVKKTLDADPVKAAAREAASVVLVVAAETSALPAENMQYTAYAEVEVGMPSVNVDTVVAAAAVQIGSHYVAAGSGQTYVWIVPRS
jgi:hypothetical protein